MEIEQILNGRRGVDALSRGETYRQAGWSRFDEGAEAYTAEQVERERSLYRGEDRSFAAAGDGVALDEEERIRRDRVERPASTFDTGV